MGFFDAAQDVFDKGMAAADRGVAAAKGAVSGLAVEQQAFVKDFVRLCEDAFCQGWHEANGGNLSYALGAAEVDGCRQFFYTTPGSWVALAQPQPGVAGQYFLVTGSGKHFRNVNVDPAANVGIVEIAGDGGSWRVVWGLKNAAKPTSELDLHLACLLAARVRNAEAKVVYHAHPASLMALTCCGPANGAAFTRLLWRSLAEAIIVVPRGVAVVPWHCPGTLELAAACAQAMESSDAVVAQNHGIFCCAESFDAAFGLVHTLEKAAEVALKARAANGGSSEGLTQIPLEGLREIAQRYGLDVDESLLEHAE
ncbi:MAG: rhamnulose-1-phosphate aldolase [Coriobacteriia bacterium]|nr:rhamnulose-1-phosphate aldolase [Coriobacteriia bacterium]